MSERRYKKVINRHAPALFPPSMEDYVTQGNPVRAIDAYVESLDMNSFGFQNSGKQYTAGQPAYPPQGLLKLYLYGYLNRVRSSRRLEKEVHRNVEAIWLMEGLKPSYKTIANFRKENAEALRQVNKDFVILCKELELFGGELVGIDGSFFKASASKASIQTQAQLEKEIQRIEQEIKEYQQTLNRQDQEDERQGIGSTAQDNKLSEKLETLKTRKQKSQADLDEMEQQGETQRSRSDKDARLLSKNGQRVAGYNVQQSIDSKHKLIVAHEVTNDGNDVKQLLPMAQRSQEVMERERLTVVADAGYYNPEQIKACQEAGITPYVSIPNKSSAIKAQGRFTREQFQFDVEQNHYRCPAGQLLKQVGKPYKKRGRMMLRYKPKASDCCQCEKREQCLTEKARIRQINRWEHEGVIDEHRARMKEKGPEMMRRRSGLAEHPFGTLKRWFGWDHFLVRGFVKVRGEMSLMVLGYNLTRVIHTIGLEAFRDYCASKKRMAEVCVESAVMA
ncbi:MAG TPA: IS1182 family transposase [Gammaproteobacteria bacterium]|nr:IS1182 family transposase [Gammaproteobacteria bacterium]